VQNALGYRKQRLYHWRSQKFWFGGGKQNGKKIVNFIWLT